MGHPTRWQTGAAAATVLVVSCALWGVGPGGAAPAAARPSTAPTWTLQSTPSPGREDGFEAVSCPSAVLCLAVGWEASSTRPGLTVPLAERWRGGAWSLERIPAAGTSAELDGVACTSARQCVAVGYLTTAKLRASVALVETYDGGKWSPARLPDPAGASAAVLNAVSCLSVSSCVGVGSAAVSGGSARSALVVTWNGSTWSAQLLPGSSPVDELDAVSCQSTVCTAIGDIGTGTTAVPQVYGFDGSTWSSQTIGTTSTGHEALFGGISCPAASTCVAVGFLRPGYTPISFVSDAGSWQSVPFPSPPHPDVVAPYGVSCASTTRCQAVGEYAVVGSGTAVLAASWRSGVWYMGAPADPTGHSPYLKGVSCVAVGDCAAVGTFTAPSPGAEDTLVERYS